MKKVTNKPKTAAEEYPELDKCAADIERWVIDAIHARTKDINSKMPYKERCVLEMLIKRLEACV